MNPLIQLKQTTSVSLVAFGLAIFGVSPAAQAVSPAPDGCYPNFTTAEGCDALSLLTTGEGNTGLGWRSLFSSSSGNFNTGVGAGALVFNNADWNTAVGAAALLLNTTGVLNVAIGFSAGTHVMTASGVTCIGANVGGADVDQSTWIGNVFGVLPQDPTTLPVVVTPEGQLGVVPSSERFKKDIATMEKVSEAILSLRPVTFHYKTDTTGTPQFGLIAEEVAKVNPALVLPDKEGKPYTVRYDAVNAMLLNEFLKARRQIDAQQKQIEALTAGLQKVSAQLELNKPVPRTVLNRQ